jgi:hypothetical protein
MKPWSVAVFESQRPHLTSFVRDEVSDHVETAEVRRILIRAPVKSGKREIAEYIAKRDEVTPPKRVHAFLSAWHRVADAEQRLELKGHNMEVFPIIDEKSAAKYLAWAATKKAAGLHIINHLDECDHGSGKKQLLSRVWASIRDDDAITTILYSATHQEVLFSGEIDDDEHNAMMEEFVREGVCIEYTPPEGYCGPATFLTAGLVKEATPFFTKDGAAVSLTPQGRQIVLDLRAAMVAEPKRNMVVLRLSGSFVKGGRSEIKENKSIYQFLKNIAAFPELHDFIVVADKGSSADIRSPRVSVEKIQWSDPLYWRRQATAIPTLLVIDQTSSRSTEWACHDRIFATHDYRNEIQYSTISQAQERVNHYRQRYGAFQPIRVFGSVKTFQLSAGLIDYGTYLQHEWESRKVTNADKWIVRKTATGHARHPDCPAAGLPEAAATKLLQELGCYADNKLSGRVAGRVVEKPIYAAAWRLCTETTFPVTFEAFCGSPPAGFVKTAVRNPFIAARAYMAKKEPALLAAGQWLGQHRGWKKLDFDRDIEGSADMGSTGGTRIKVCYRAGSLGVAIVWQTGTEMVDSLRAYKSMYGSA